MIYTLDDGSNHKWLNLVRYFYKFILNVLVNLVSEKVLSMNTATQCQCLFITNQPFKNYGSNTWSVRSLNWTGSPNLGWWCVLCKDNAWRPVMLTPSRVAQFTVVALSPGHWKSLYISSTQFEKRVGSFGIGGWHGQLKRLFDTGKASHTLTIVIVIVIAIVIVIYFTQVTASYKGEASGLWINAYPPERSLLSFPLGELRICKEYEEAMAVWPVSWFRWKYLLLTPGHFTSDLKTSRWYVNKAPHPLPSAMLTTNEVVWWAARGIIHLAGSRERTCDPWSGKQVTYPQGHESLVGLPCRKENH